MLKRFFLNLLSSFVGAWLALILFGVAVAIMMIAAIGSMAVKTEQTPQVKSRSILKIELDGTIQEREMAIEPDFAELMQGNLDAPMTLDVLTAAIREAAENDDIVALYLKCGSLSASTATLNAIRHEVEEFKKSGKKVLAYGDSYTQGCYYIASVADKIYMNPMGEINLQGLSSTGMYLKNLLDKLGVQFQVVKVGTYKSAVEPYILENMSDPARAQMDTLLGNMWGFIRGEIAKSRKGLTAAKIDSLINKDFISFAPQKEAVKAGLVDSLVYERQFNERLAAISGREVEKLNFVGPKTLVSQSPWSDSYSSKKQIAVLYACGEIADGNDNAINYETLVPLIVKLADNDKVKGMVLRVNSPGGSAFGSDQIGEALDYFQSKGKPMAVSMGDYAASGGYWISACADKIFADPLTITGSIGIFGLIPNFKGTLDKVGVNMATVSTNPEANFPTGVAPMNETQLGVMQKYVERGYADFTSRVAKGRHMPVEKVRRIGEGRVWDALKARQIGLVDSIAYLQNAIEWVAAKADVRKSYDVAAYPEFQPNFWTLMSMGGNTMEEIGKQMKAGNREPLYQMLLKRINDRKRIQARMPAVKVSL